jgi:beta-lactamase class A
MTATVGRDVDADVDAALAAARVSAFFHVRDLDGGDEVGRGSDTPVVLASVFKVPIALEIACQFESARLVPTERIRVPLKGRTAGGTGLSTLQDEVELSLRDLAQLMISVSDNAATDIMLARVGRDAVNERLRGLGLTSTVIEGDCAFLLGRLDAQLDLTEPERERLARGDEGVFADIDPGRFERCEDLHAESTNRSTPREMARLLELIWTDEAGPPAACAFVRRIMEQQVWPHRLRAGFPGSVRTSGKTGTLPFIRNEAGVVEHPDGRRYAAAVFTVAATPDLQNPDADRVIGTIARIAVDALRAS